MATLVPALELSQRQCTKGSKGSNRTFSGISLDQLVEVFETVYERYPGYVVIPERVRNADGKYSFPLVRLSRIADICNHGYDPPYYYLLPSVSGDMSGTQLVQYSEGSLSLGGVPNVLITSTKSRQSSTHVRRVRSIWCMADDWAADLSDDGYEPVYRLMVRLVKKQADANTDP